VVKHCEKEHFGPETEVPEGHIFLNIKR